MTTHLAHRCVRTTRRALSRSLPLVALALATGCTSEYTFTPLPGATCDQACNVSVQSRYDSTVTGENLAAAVEIAAWGSTGFPTATALDKRLRTAASGAPAFTSGGLAVGRVLLHPIDTQSGEIDTSSPPDVLAAPAQGTREFGAALLAADVRDGFSTVTSEGLLRVVRNVAWGEEILVGAPGTDNQRGAVYWYANQGSHSAGWTLGGTLTAPTTRLGARFGEALAAPFQLDARSTDHPVWIAVGAPGESRVYIFMVLPGSSTATFLPLMELVGPTGSDFGASLAIAELNGDEWPELVVGAPGDASGGRVRVFRGISGFSPVSAADPLVLSASGSLAGGGEYGTSVAVGRIRGNPSRAMNGLVVGVPGFDAGGATNRGGICQYQLRNTGGGALIADWTKCSMNPVARDDERYGQRVAVGNFAAPRAAGDSDGFCAAGDEIAVGIPGRDRTSPAITDAGAVHILGRGDEGGDVLATGRMIFGSDTSQFAGRALAADYVQATDSEDLLIGSPQRSAGRGRVSLTRAMALATNDPLTGEWRSTDSAGNPFRVQLQWDSGAGRLAFTMLRNQTMTFRNGGTVCEALGHPLTGSGRFDLPTIPWATTPVTHAEAVTVDVSDVVGFNANAQATVTFNAAASTLTLAIDEGAGVLGMVPAACNIVGNPFVFTRTSAPTCD